MAVLIKPNSLPEAVYPKEGKFTNEELHGLVGGYLEMVGRQGKQIMFSDEDGYRKNLPINEVASLLAGQTIVGSVVICEYGKEVD